PSCLRENVERKRLVAADQLKILSVEGEELGADPPSAQREEDVVQHPLGLGSAPRLLAGDRGDHRAGLLPVVERRRDEPARSLERADLTLDQAHRPAVEGARVELLDDHAREVRLKNPWQEVALEEVRPRLGFEREEIDVRVEEDHRTGYR